jgi:prepilin-type N-terminal cleavage/methylation domain-containing protein
MKKRSGFTLLEILVSCLLLAVLLTIGLQLAAAVAAQRKAAALRETALQEAANVMERLCSQRWEDLTAEAARRQWLSDEAARSLPGAAARVEIEPADDEPAAKRIGVEVRWEPASGKPSERVRLVAWKYRGAEHREEESR